MLYSLYELNRAAVSPLHAAAEAQSLLLRLPFNPLGMTPLGRTAAAAQEVLASVTRRYRKPAWGITETEIGGELVAVRPRPVWSDTWCTLLHFQRDPKTMQRLHPKPQPRVLIAAPMSGHYATLLRGTVEAFLPDHEVYITDWTDARMVPIVLGRFDLHGYIDYIRAMLRFIGPGAHTVAVCQPGPPVLAAIALMSEDGDPSLPASMAFMGSPIDARCSPTVPNKLAEQRELRWFRENMVHPVPPIYPGAFRQVYPGFLQLASFMGMNLDRHVDAHWDYFRHLTDGDGENAGKHREFYDEYLAVMDLTEEFYVQTIRDVFQEYRLARGVLEHRGQRVRPDLIRDVALMTVEGEKDDISGIGQTQAAHDLCRNIPESRRIDYIQPGVGHYGVFNGRRFRTEIYPRMRDFITEFGAEHGARPSRDAA